MAQFTVRVVGGKIQTVNERNVGDAKARLGLSTYSAVINGVAVRDDHVPQAGDTVVLATNSKGGDR